MKEKSEVYSQILDRLEDAEDSSREDFLALAEPLLDNPNLSQEERRDLEDRIQEVEREDKKDRRPADDYRSMNDNIISSFKEQMELFESLLNEVYYANNKPEIESELQSIIEAFMIRVIKKNSFKIDQEKGIQLLNQLRDEFYHFFDGQFPGESVDFRNSGEFLQIAKRYFESKQVEQNFHVSVLGDEGKTERLGPVGAAEILGDLRKNRTRKIKTRDIVSSEPDVQDLAIRKQKPQILDPEDDGEVSQEPHYPTIDMTPVNKLGTDASEEPEATEEPSIEEPEEVIPDEEEEPEATEEPSIEEPEEVIPDEEEEPEEAPNELSQLEDKVKSGDYEGVNFLKAKNRVVAAREIEQMIQKASGFGFMKVFGYEDLSNSEQMDSDSVQKHELYQREARRLWMGILQHARPEDNQMRDISYQTASTFIERMIRFLDSLDRTEYLMGEKSQLSKVLKMALGADMEMAYLVDLFGRTFPYAFAENIGETDQFTPITTRDLENWFRKSSYKYSILSKSNVETIKQVQKVIVPIIQDSFLSDKGKEKSKRGEPVSINDIKPADPESVTSRFKSDETVSTVITEMPDDVVEEIITDAFDAVVTNNLQDEEGEFYNEGSLNISENQEEIILKFIMDNIIKEQEVDFFQNDELIDDILDEFGGAYEEEDFAEIGEEEEQILSNFIYYLVIVELEDKYEEGLITEDNLLEVAKDIVLDYKKRYSEFEKTQINEPEEV